jgi:hypothetical protein
MTSRVTSLHNDLDEDQRAAVAALGDELDAIELAAYVHALKARRPDDPAWRAFYELAVTIVGAGRCPALASFVEENRDLARDDAA